MDLTPLTQKIEDNARQSAQALLSEAQARVQELFTTCDNTLENGQRDARRRAQAEGEELERNLKRLHELEARKDLLHHKRTLISEGFDAALHQLRALPQAQLRQLFMQQLVQFAQGNEQVTAGDINPGFFDAAFLTEANEQLVKAGKPGDLKAGNEKQPGVCGLVLSTAGTQTHLTVETLLSQHRDALEGEVAQLLCGDLR